MAQDQLIDPETLRGMQLIAQRGVDFGETIRFLNEGTIPRERVPLKRRVGEFAASVTALVTLTTATSGGNVLAEDPSDLATDPSDDDFIDWDGEPVLEDDSSIGNGVSDWSGDEVDPDPTSGLSSSTSEQGTGPYTFAAENTQPVTSSADQRDSAERSLDAIVDSLNEAVVDTGDAVMDVAETVNRAADDLTDGDNASDTHSGWQPIVDKIGSELAEATSQEEVVEVLQDLVEAVDASDEAVVGNAVDEPFLEDIQRRVIGTDSLDNQSGSASHGFTDWEGTPVESPRASTPDSILDSPGVQQNPEQAGNPIDFRGYYTIDSNGAVHADDLRELIRTNRNLFPKALTSEVFQKGDYYKFFDSMSNLRFDDYFTGPNERFVSEDIAVFLILFNDHLAAIGEERELMDAASMHNSEHFHAGDIDIKLAQTEAQRKADVDFMINLQRPGGAYFLHHIVSGDWEIVNHGNDTRYALERERPRMSYNFTNHGKDPVGGNHMHISADGALDPGPGAQPRVNVPNTNGEENHAPLAPTDFGSPASPVLPRSEENTPQELPAEAPKEPTDPLGSEEADSSIGNQITAFGGTPIRGDSDPSQANSGSNGTNELAENYETIIDSNERLTDDQKQFYKDVARAIDIATDSKPGLGEVNKAALAGKMALESGYGKSELATHAWNMSGNKASQSQIDQGLAYYVNDDEFNPDGSRKKSAFINYKKMWELENGLDNPPQSEVDKMVYSVEVNLEKFNRLEFYADSVACADDPLGFVLGMIHEVAVDCRSILQYQREQGVSSYATAVNYVESVIARLVDHDLDDVFHSEVDGEWRQILADIKQQRIAIGNIGASEY